MNALNFIEIHVGPVLAIIGLIVVIFSAIRTFLEAKELFSGKSKK